MLWKLSYLRPNETGIIRVPSIVYFDEKTDDTADPWWKDLVPDVSTVGTIFVGGGTLMIFSFLIEVLFVFKLV